MNQPGPISKIRHKEQLQAKPWINERGLGALAIETSLSSSDYLVEFFFHCKQKLNSSD